MFKFRKLLAGFTAAVMAAGAFTVTASAAREIKLNNAKSAASGKQVSATMKGGTPVDYKIKLEEKGDLTVNFSGNATMLYIYVYNASLKSVAPVEPILTKGDYDRKYLDDSGVWGYLGDGIKVDGDSSKTCAGKLVFKNLSKGTYYVRFYMGADASGSGKLTATFSGGGSDKSSSDDDNSGSGGIDVVIDEGDKVTLRMSGSNVKWSSSNEKVATVSSSGRVTGKKAGTATITAKSGSTAKTIKVIVE